MGRTLALAAVAAVLLAPGTAPGQHAASGATHKAHVGGFYIGAGLMQAWGNGGFTISGRDSTVGRFSSVLEFPMDGTYFVLEAGIEEIGPGFGAHLRYGSCGSLEGTTTDTDFAWDITSREYIKSFTGTDGENVFFTFDVSYRLHERADEGGGRSRLDVFAGYALQDAAFEMSDVHTIIQNGVPVDTWYGGVAATYDMEFRGVRVGVRGEMPIGRSSTISGTVAVLPYVKADGFGQWIVRRKAFDHDATGWGFDCAVRYEYALSENITLWAGAGYTHLRGADGTDDQFYFTGKPIGTASLDELESEYGFVMIGGELRF